MQREPTRCPVCGRTVEQAASGRGRAKEYHDTCKIVRNAIDEMARNLECVEFAGMDDARCLANELFQYYNGLHVVYMARKREALRCVEAESAAVEAR